jgi:hypothetical protein
MAGGNVPPAFSLEFNMPKEQNAEKQTTIVILRDGVFIEDDVMVDATTVLAVDVDVLPDVAQILVERGLARYV